MLELSPGRCTGSVLHRGEWVLGGHMPCPSTEQRPGRALVGSHCWEGEDFGADGEGSSSGSLTGHAIHCTLVNFSLRRG